MRGEARSAVRLLADALDAVASTDVATLDDVALREQMLDLLAVNNRVHAELVRRVDVSDRRGLCEQDGFRTMRAWLVGFGRLSGGAASRLVAAARVLRRLPKLAIASQAGDVTPEHLQQVVRLADRVGVEQIAPVEATLADAAQVLDLPRFQAVCERVDAHLNPDGGEDPAKAYEKRGVSLVPVQGMMSIRGQLDPDGGATVAAALDALMRAPGDDDQRTGAQRRADALVDLAGLALRGDRLPSVGGQRPQVGVLLFPQALSPATLASLAKLHKGEATGVRLREFHRAQMEARVADWTRPGVSLDQPERAAAEVGRVSRDLRGGFRAPATAGTAAVPAKSHVPAAAAVSPESHEPAAAAASAESHEPAVDGPRSLSGPMWSVAGWADPPWLSWVGVISPVVAQRIACDADIWRIILDPSTGMPLDVGRGHRLVPHWMRRALVARDRGCRWPGCHAPPEWCDGHHLKPWAEQGETTVDGCVLLCRHHHVLAHEGGWAIRLDLNSGHVTVTRPGGLRYDVSGGRTASWNGPTSQIG